MIKKRLTTFSLVILLVILTGSVGYALIFKGQASIIDCIYMTVISITSVGYGEVLKISGNPVAQIFTMGLITFGMGLILYAISSITALFIEGELSGARRRRRMKKEIEGLLGHIILVGEDEGTRPLMKELKACGEEVVFITQSQEGEAEEKEKKGFFIKGDPTEDSVLEAAGIRRAKGVIIALPQDKDTLFITMTARMMNPSLRIVAQASAPSLEAKFVKAGADSVVSPNTIGALRMASQMIRPAAVDFLDEMLRSEKETLRIHEVTVTQGSGLAGRRLGQTQLDKKHDLLVLGLKHQGKIRFNPGAETPLEEGMTLVVMGRMKKIKKIQEEIGPPSAAIS